MGMNIDESRHLRLDRESKGTRYYRNAVERHWDPGEIDLTTDRANLADYVEERIDTQLDLEDFI